MKMLQAIKEYCNTDFRIFNGAELAGATGARAPVLFLPRPEILGHILYVLSRFSGQIPEIPRPRPVVHLHYLGHFGASEYTILYFQNYYFYFSM